MKKLEELVKKPIEFFKELQERYVFIDPELSKLFKEISDEHRRQA